MKLPAASPIAWLLLATLAGAAPPTAPLPKPLVHAHAHNDYLHERPLLDALDHGFCSVEADIYLVDGKLLVAHDRDKLKTDRTLQALYLDPLRDRVKKNGGRVYPDGPEFTLLIDLKTDSTNTYPALREMLAQYADMLTTFRDGKREAKAVLAIITGNRTKQMFAGEKIRYAAFDGRTDDLDSNEPADFVPWVSADWKSLFQWRGFGVVPDAEKQKLKQIVAKAHQQGRRVRFWGAPDFDEFWKAMLDSGVDLINTDDLAGLERFLKKKPN
jgi:hypothetical protein